MKRRQFVHGLAAAPLLPAAGAARALSAPLGPEPEPALPESRHDALAAVWRDDFARLQPSYDSRLRLRVPEGLRGTLFRNGPALMTLGGTAYRHWLDGDGMMHAFRFEDGLLRHRGRLTRTAKLVAESAAGRRLSPGYGTSLPGTIMTGPEAMNTANINALPFNGELLALWEGGAAYSLDPRTLETRGRKRWSPYIDELPFSAHPRVDGAGNLWSFGYLPGRGGLMAYRIDAQGGLAQQAFVPAPNADFVHDFAVTERYLVFLLMPYLFDATKSDPSLSMLDRYVWRDEGSMVLVVDKATLQPVRQFQCPTTAVLHFGNAWEDGSVLRFGATCYADFADLFNRRLSRTMTDSALAWSPSRWTEFAADLATGTLRSEVPVAGTVEFPSYDLRRTGRRSERTILLASRRPRSAPLFGFDTVRVLEHRRERVQEYDYGHGVLAEEHVFVPAPGAADEDRGWIVGTSLDWRRGRSRVSVFDAGCVERGPIEQVELPYSLPLGLHGHFLAA